MTISVVGFQQISIDYEYMLPPKPKSEVSTLNDLIAQITPYLQRDATYSEFIKRRIDAQIEEIQDSYYYKAAKYYFLFSVGEIEAATRMAEETVSERPQDVISWGNYILCSLYTIGLERALNLSTRAADITNSPRMVRDSMYYAWGMGDFITFELYAEKFFKMGLLEEEMLNEDNGSLPAAFQQSALAKKSGLSDEISAVGKIMNSMLSPSDQLDAQVNLHLVDDEDESSYVLEIIPSGLTPQRCADLSVALVKNRVMNKVTNWDVVGIFATEASKQRDC